MINFSDSPLHFDTIVAALILKNVVLISVATALAKRVLPVPGGPNNNIPFQGSNKPVKKWGYFIGHNKASSIIFFAMRALERF